MGLSRARTKEEEDADRMHFGRLSSTTRFDSEFHSDFDSRYRSDKSSATAVLVVVLVLSFLALAGFVTAVVLYILTGKKKDAICSVYAKGTLVNNVDVCAQAKGSSKRAFWMLVLAFFAPYFGFFSGIPYSTVSKIAKSANV